MSELLNKQLNTAIALRKLTFFEIEQNHTTFPMRPQLHVLIVKPFGTIKSSYTEPLEDLLHEDLIIRDELTKPAILGTIGKNGKYVPGLPAIVGGKILVIDEFNNLDEFGLKALLGILENQKIGRELGHEVKNPQCINRNEWTDLTVTGGYIKGKINFTCIAFSMFYPKPKNRSVFEENPQQLLGLKSRFSPNFSEPEHEDLIDALRGKKPFELEDFGKSSVRRISIEEEAYQAYIDEFSKITKKFAEGDNALIEKKQLGFITRVSSDLLRFSAYDYLKIYADTGKNVVYEGLTLKIKEPEIMVENAKIWAEPLLKQYLHEELASNYGAFCLLLKEKPGETHVFYAQRLNVSTKTIQRWNKKLEDEVLKVEQKYH